MVLVCDVCVVDFWFDDSGFGTQAVNVVVFIVTEA
jgi:hypothetical protein